MVDEAASEATFRFTVKNIRNLKSTVLSQPCYVRNLPWQIKVMPREKRKYLGFFVQCNDKSKSSTWSCFANAELRLFSQKPDTEAFVRKIQHKFCSKEDDWGFSTYMVWTDVVNPDKGYIKENEITLEVHIIAKMPHGVSSAPKKQNPSSVGDAASAATDASSGNLVKGPNGEVGTSDVIEVEETTTSDATVTQGSSAENSSQTGDVEQSTAEELLQAIQQGTHATEATTLSTLIQQSTQHLKNVDGNNSILNVLQRVECILSSLLNITQQQHSKETNKDEFHYFALSIAAQLRKLPAHVAVDTQNKIQNSLLTAKLTSMLPSAPAPSQSHT